MSRRRRDESGAVAIMFALLATVLMGMAALGVDLASQVNERQKLQDAMDAGAQAGAYQLPNNAAKSNSARVRMRARLRGCLRRR